MATHVTWCENLIRIVSIDDRTGYVTGDFVVTDPKQDSNLRQSIEHGRIHTETWDQINRRYPVRMERAMSGHIA
jgi:ribulose bisphosphate carboxylase small subunit